MNYKLATRVLTIACLLTPFTALADIDISLNQYVVNASFEIPTTTCCSFPTGWFSGGTANGGAGNWNPTSDSNSGLTAVSGNQVGWINNYSGAAGVPPEQNYFYLGQTLDLSGGMVQGATYTLTYDVAVRADISTPSWYRVQINGNYSPSCITCYAITSGSTTSFVPGTWYSESVSYTAQAADAGQQPTIYLVNDGSVSGQVLTQVEFDVPEPLTGLILGLQFAAVALFVSVRRKAHTR